MYTKHNEPALGQNTKQQQSWVFFITFPKRNVKLPSYSYGNLILYNLINSKSNLKNLIKIKSLILNKIWFLNLFLLDFLVLQTIYYFSHVMCTGLYGI